MTLGTMATEFGIAIDFAKLRQDRTQKANEQMKADGVAALLCFDPDSIRYITSTKLNDWTNNKLARSCLLIVNHDPILFEVVARLLQNSNCPLGSETGSTRLSDRCADPFRSRSSTRMPNSLRR